MRWEIKHDGTRQPKPQLLSSSAARAQVSPCFHGDLQLQKHPALHPHEGSLNAPTETWSQLSQHQKYPSAGSLAGTTWRTAVGALHFTFSDTYKTAWQQNTETGNTAPTAWENKPSPQWGNRGGKKHATFPALSVLCGSRHEKWSPLPSPLIFRYFLLLMPDGKS